MLLNIDVLAMIMQYLDYGDISRFSWTCRTVRECAMVHLVNHPCYTTTQFLKFCQFMCTDPSRMLLLRRMDILIDKMNPEELDQVCSILEQAKNLRILDLRSSERFLSLDERIPSAIASLPNLTCLHLTMAFSRSVQLVYNLQCRLRKLRISGRWSIMSDPDYIASVSTLPNRGVLETVHTLDLTSDGGIKSIDSLCYTFPNLRRLNISISGSTVYREAAEGNSEENNHLPITLQTVKVHRWEALQKLVGNCDQLHALGLTCHIEHIRFRDLDGPFGDRFPSICDTCRPKAVTLYSPRLASFLKEKKSTRTRRWSFFHAPYLQSVTIKWLDRLARDDEVPGNTSNFEEQFRVDVVDFLQYVLASTSIEELFLECFVKKWSKLDAILQHLETSKQETFIRGIADAIPSLQRVAFSIEFSWSDVQKSFWCISREEGGEVLLRRLDKSFKSAFEYPITFGYGTD